MTVNENSKPLLTVKGLKQYFKVSNNYTVHAVENVSFQIYPGETYGLVGESGSGKSTIGRSIIRLYDPTAGEINFNGMDISGRINKANSQALRTQMQMIFQDPIITPFNILVCSYYFVNIIFVNIITAPIRFQVPCIEIFIQIFLYFL